jgi:hypothetical protein
VIPSPRRSHGALNRSAIAVRPKLPFLDWLHAVHPTSAALTLANLTRELTIYLVDECDPDDERACLQAVCSTTFEDQLDGWWRVRETGSTPRSFAVFRRTFDCQFHPMLLDLADRPLIVERI